MWTTVLIGALALAARPRLRAGQRRAPPVAPIDSGSTPRAVAHSVLLRCARNGAFAERALTGALGKASLSSADTALATTLVYGVLREQRLLDFQLEQLTRVNRTDDACLTALRIGAFELTQLRTPDHAAVGEAVALARDPRRRGFLNGVLRNLARRRNGEGNETLQEPEALLSPREALAVRCSIPGWLLSNVAAALPGGEAGEAALAAWASSCQQTPRLAVRVNLRRASVADVSAKLTEAGAQVEVMPQLPCTLLVSGGGEPRLLPGFAEGEWTVQDPGAQAVALLAAPPKGGVVLDLCAAPGGKTAHLAELMGDSGTVLSVDVHANKLGLIRDSCTRLGLQSVSARATDATDADALRALLIKAAECERAEAVVVDAPCSGLGTLRRNPELRAKPQAEFEAHARKLLALQTKLLDAAASRVAEGGSLTYSVCTPRPEECEEVVAAFLERHPQFSCPSIDDPQLLAFATDSAALGGERKCIRTWSHVHECDSHFAARMVRSA